MLLLALSPWTTILRKNVHINVQNTEKFVFINACRNTYKHFRTLQPGLPLAFASTLVRLKISGGDFGGPSPAQPRAIFYQNIHFFQNVAQNDQFFKATGMEILVFW